VALNLLQAASVQDLTDFCALCHYVPWIGGVTRVPVPGVKVERQLVGNHVVEKLFAKRPNVWANALPMAPTLAQVSLT
jgi:hypothetical protein